MTLINAEKLKNSYAWWEGSDRQLTRDEAKHYFDAMIDAQAAVKAEPIVRCKDCVYYTPEVDEPHKSTCQRLWGGMPECNADSYCSDGVRKNEVENDIDRC